MKLKRAEADRDAAKIMIEGLRRAGARANRESLITALESMSEVSIGGFRVSYSRTDHVASNQVELSVLMGDGRVRT